MENITKVEKELREVLDTEPKRKEERQDFLFRLLELIDGLEDDEFNKLSAESQEWFNKACDAAEGKKAIPEFAEPETKAPGRRRATTSTEEAAPVLAVGATVKAVTKRDKVYEGTVVEIDDEIVVIKTADGEEELNRGRLASLEVVGGGKEKAADDEPSDPLKVGVEVEVVTKRDKKYTGKIIEIDDQIVAIKTADGEEEFNRDRVASITPVGKASSGRASRTSTADTGGKEKAAPAAKTAKGPSATTQIRQMIVDHLKDKEALISKEALTKAVEKAELEAKQATTDLVLSETTRIIEMLDEAELLAIKLSK